MATPEKYHYYDKNMLKALIIGCVTGVPILIVPAMLGTGFNGSMSGNSSSFVYRLLDRESQRGPMNRRCAR